MPSLHSRPQRHVVIDKRPGHYLCFPDVLATPSGRLVCAYRQADSHVAARCALLTSLSDDNGKSWTAPRLLNATAGHCPRLSLISGHRIVVIDDMTQANYWSVDNGDTFLIQPFGNMATNILDRVIELAPNQWLTTGHCHRGTHPHPWIRQAPSEQMAYRSNDEGRVWNPVSVIASERHLVLCEGSMTRLADGRLVALMRENSFVYEPMYFCTSDDDGATWSLPRPTPLIGHRPCLGLTPSGRLLVTYRNVAPDGGTAAWIGSFEDLDQDFAVHAWRPSPDNPSLTPEGLLVHNPPGPEASVRYALRPMTDPARATAELTATVQMLEGQQSHCALHLGIWWRIQPGRLEPEGGHPAIPLPTERPARLTLRYQAGQVSLLVDDTPAGTYPADPKQADTRAILAGCSALKENNGGKSLWLSLGLTIDEPAFSRQYRWRWEHTAGHPDAKAQASVLELANARHANSGDYGYSGWTPLKDGRFFCTYHHAGGQEPDYVPGRSSHVRGTWFEESDFT